MAIEFIAPEIFKMVEAALSNGRDPKVIRKALRADKYNLSELQIDRVIHRCTVKELDSHYGRDHRLAKQPVTEFTKFNERVTGVATAAMKALK